MVSRFLVALAADLSEEWGSHRGRRSSERIGPATRWLRGLLDGKKTGIGELPADHKEKRRWGFGKSSLSLDCWSDWRTLQRVSLPKCCLVKLFNDALLKEIKATVVRHPDTLISFRQHGRELITSEVAWQLLSILAKERNMQRVDLTFIQKLLDNLVIKGTARREEDQRLYSSCEEEKNLAGCWYGKSRGRVKEEGSTVRLGRKRRWSVFFSGDDPRLQAVGAKGRSCLLFSACATARARGRRRLGQEVARRRQWRWRRVS
ncbi:hypothetical protein ZIOFF_055299 [Zingiber officinale]|uniref:Uncharacterized protein n=1 Tax=Zingiber officinale TaxID=94328 RepID=A0A8J5FG71_ZINOF|nr:hypothetical protein ZIOFF_055299 [Zingiber officinale]